VYTRQGVRSAGAPASSGAASATTTLPRPAFWFLTPSAGALRRTCLPPRAVAPLVRELYRLPETQVQDLQSALQEEPELERVCEVTNTARWLSRIG